MLKKSNSDTKVYFNIKKIKNLNCNIISTQSNRYYTYSTDITASKYNIFHKNNK